MSAVVTRQPYASQPSSEKPQKRQPWAGGLSDEELKRPGGVLLAMLIAHANECGDQLADMAKKLSVSYGYIAQLRGGGRRPEHISDEVANACAAYLGVPRLTVLLAAGRVKPEDVLEDVPEMLMMLPAAIRYIQQHPNFGPLMPADILTASNDLKLFVVTLFEAATGRSLLPGRRDPVALAEQVRQFESYREKLLTRAQEDADRRAT